MKMPEWVGKLHRHPHGKYFLWSAGAVMATFAAVFVFTLLAPVPGSAQGLSRHVAVTGDNNVTPLANIPNVGPGDASINGKTLQQQCQAKVAKQHWGICCSPPNYMASEACQKEINKQPDQQPPQDQGGEQQPLTPAELKLLPVALQKEFAKINAQVQQYEKLAAYIEAEMTKMANCELGCPGGALAIQCTEKNKDHCIAHDKCIRACDKNYPQLKAKMDKLKKMEAAITKKAAAFTKKVEAYKAKNKRKFRAIDGARH